MIRPERVFKRLVRLVPDLADLEAGVARVSKISESGVFMDLHLDVLSRSESSAEIIIKLALAHYYKQNGDLVPDPDMVIRVRLMGETAEALSYQDWQSYKEVYLGDGQINVTQKVHQNIFLGQWLLNAWKQGHRLGP